MLEAFFTSDISFRLASTFDPPSTPLPKRKMGLLESLLGLPLIVQLGLASGLLLLYLLIRYPDRGAKSDTCESAGVPAHSRFLASKPLLASNDLFFISVTFLCWFAPNRSFRPFFWTCAFPHQQLLGLVPARIFPSQKPGCPLSETC